MYKVAKAKAKHCEAMAPHLRMEDVLEVWASSLFVNSSSGMEISDSFAFSICFVIIKLLFSRPSRTANYARPAAGKFNLF